jgi:pyruvate/2-oxoglutarate dehydrogenase complex dihydrolipoamide acyltransferase (E2) component
LIRAGESLHKQEVVAVTRPRSWLSAGWLAGVLVLAGCSDAGGPAGSPAASEEPTETESATMTFSPRPTSKGPAAPQPTVTVAPGERPAQAAARDLAERLGVDEKDVRMLRSVEVTWPDGSVGCPVPGMSYAQVLTDGTLVELSVGGVRYEYHSGGGRGLFLCRNPQRPSQVHG